MTSDPLARLPDYPAVRQVQDALWGAGEVRGAAVMIGSGLSRAALRAAEDTRTPPLWSDFSRAMTERLHGSDPLRDPLKIADEYEAALGRHALDALIRDLVRDSHWRPGPLHERLLSLPWADVLTTNWDTLLERTPLNDPDRRYEVVRVPADIARTRAPRIVKLHGSMPSHTPFVFTGEDFRTYPHKFAPFVNLAQQVLLENELCLIGFSGDDPNFLQWSGWVRDQLGASARRIRLVGVLNLSPSRRRVLEQRNISPIDLAPLVEEGVPEGEKHLVALGLFLESLWAARPRAPYVWSRARLQEADIPAGEADETLAFLQASWRADRDAYPGWAVAPPGERQRLRWETTIVQSRFMAAYKAGSPPRQAGALVELVWRHDTAFWSHDRWLFDAVGAALADPAAELRPVERSALLASRIRVARLGDLDAEFQTGLAELEAMGDAKAVVAYERALWARDRFDLAGVEAQLAAIAGDDPLWGLRRAALLAALHRAKDAARAIQAVLADIRQRRAQDPRSIWLLSREAWAAFLGRASAYELRHESDPSDVLREEAEEPLGRYQAMNCDPWDELTSFDRALDEHVRERMKGTANDRHFDPGVYVQMSGTRFVSQTQTPPLAHLLWLSERVGVPARVGHMGILGERAELAYAAIDTLEDGDVWRAAAAIRTYDKGLINQVFNRIAVAAYDESLVDSLFTAIRGAIEFGLTRLNGEGAHEWVDVIRDWMQLSSRLAIRLPPAAAAEALKWGLRLAADPRVNHWWVFEHLDALMSRSFAAVTPSNRAAFGLDLLRVTLPVERGANGMDRYWPEPARWDPALVLARPEADARWNQRIGELLALARVHDPESRTRALWRLSHLEDAGVLTGPERQSFGEVLWRDAGPDGIPRETTFHPFAFLRLPETRPGQASDGFRSQVVAPLLNGALNGLRLYNLTAATGRGDWTLDAAEGERLLQHLMDWRPAPVPSFDIMHEREGLNREVSEKLGSCAAKAALPPLDPTNLDDALGKRLVDHVIDAETPSWLFAAAQTIRLVPDRASEVVAALRRAIARGDDDALRHAVGGVQEFLKVAPDGVPPQVLVADIVGACAVRRDLGLNWLLPAAQAFVEAGCLREDEVARLIQALAFLQEETAYASWRSSDARTNSLSLIRRDCVRIAKSLQLAGVTDPAVSAWLEAGTADPLPEVRYALEEEPT